MGGDEVPSFASDLNTKLKSTPPAWAGTPPSQEIRAHIELKSTPPAWAGTKLTKYIAGVVELKSTPPAWAGTTDNFSSLIV